MGTGESKYLTKALKILEKNPNFTIGINGKWTSGKDAAAALSGAIAKLPGNPPATQAAAGSQLTTKIETDQMTKSEVDGLLKGLEEVLADKTCTDFLTAILTEAGNHARNKPITTDMLDLFKRVRKQNGFAFATSYTTGPAGTSVMGYNGVSGSVMSGDAQVLLSSWALTNFESFKRTRQFFLYTALGELTHIAGERTYRGYYGSIGYGDEGLARATSIVATRMSDLLAAKGITVGPAPDPSNNEANSRYYHSAMELICRRK